MLQYLQIKNLALLECADLDFEAGFTVITGETGAGKSVLLGALSLLSGARTDKTCIHKDAQACEVQASLYFAHCEPINTFLEQKGLPLCEDRMLIIRRVIHRTQTPRIWINGALAPLTLLQQLGVYWIDFHGPGEPQKLFHETYQRALLDVYADVQTLLLSYQKSYREWKQLHAQIKHLIGEEQLSDDEQAYYQAQVEAMEAFEISEDAISRLENEYKRLSNTQELSELTHQITSGFHADGGIIERFQEVLRFSQALCALDPEVGKPLQERIQSLVIESEDIANEYEHLASGLNHDEDFVRELQERMHRWLDIKRKYGPGVEGVLSNLKELKEKLFLQSNIESTIDNLKKEGLALEKELNQLAREITQKRTEVAKKLSQRVEGLLAVLGFKKAQFEVEVVPEVTLKEHGNSSVRIAFAPNVGQDLMPLNKIASSGETARVMLALKAVLAEADATPILVFDEVDANVGGEVGAQVGKELARLASKHQVFCVTHLPQVAAQAQSHFTVEKKPIKNRTQVFIKPIHPSSSEREEEIARMLGDRASDSALEHAKKLLKQAPLSDHLAST